MRKGIFVKSLYAGILIGLASLLYISVENAYIGSLLFSFGLLVICAEGLYLYTGKVGYLCREKHYFKTVGLTLFGNILGIALISFMGLFAKRGLSITASLLVESKLSNGVVEAFILAIFCGMMMYIGVEGYRRVKSDAAKVVIVIFAVMIFILAKFEHSIANMAYFIVAKSFTLKSLFYIIIMILGNAVGANMLSFIDKTIDKNDRIEGKNEKTN